MSANQNQIGRPLPSGKRNVEVRIAPHNYDLSGNAHLSESLDSLSCNLLSSPPHFLVYGGHAVALLAPGFKWNFTVLHDRENAGLRSNRPRAICHLVKKDILSSNRIHSKQEFHFISSITTNCRLCTKTQRT